MAGGRIHHIHRRRSSSDAIDWYKNPQHLGVEPKIGVVNPPKWMVYFMENLSKMDDLGGFPILFGNTHLETGKVFKQTCRIVRTCLVFTVSSPFFSSL